MSETASCVTILSQDTPTETAADDVFSWAIEQVIKKCKCPDSEMFLPDLLADGPLQPYHADEWDVKGLGSKTAGSSAICSATGLGEPNPKKNMSLHLSDITVNGIANVKPIDSHVEPRNGKSKDVATVTIEFSAFGKDDLPEGVNSNLTITSDFIIRQPCRKPDNGGEKTWTAVGKGEIQVAIKKATGRSKVVFYTKEGSQLCADAKGITFQIAGLSCNGNGRAQGENDQDNPAISVEVTKLNIHKNRKRWFEFINNVVNMDQALCKFQSEINNVLEGKKAKKYLAKVIVKQVKKLLP